MKIGWLGAVATPTIMEHTKTVGQGIMPGCEGVMVEDAMQSTPDDIAVINTCTGIKNFLLHDELRKEFNEQYNIIDHTPHAFLYTFFNGENFGDIIEIAHKTHFMSHDAGPAIGYVQGAAMPCSPDIFAAFPALTQLQNGLVGLHYRGEVSFGITKNFEICNIAFGHFMGGFSLYSEMSTQTAQSNIEFCFGETDVCKVHEKCIAFNTLLSIHPFPSKVKVNTKVQAPAGAEKHLYKQWYTPEQEVALVSCWGITSTEARSRVYRVINSCKQYTPDLQYRSDIGRNCRFVFNQENYLALDACDYTSSISDEE